MNGEEKKAKASIDPIPNPQYICQYKIQNIVPNTFSNKESIAHKESLHYLLRFFSLYSIVEGGEFLITFPHYIFSAIYFRGSLLHSEFIFRSSDWVARILQGERSSLLPGEVNRRSLRESPLSSW